MKLPIYPELHVSDPRLVFSDSLLLGSEDIFSHISLSGYQPLNGSEGKILFGELIMLVSAMKNRADQLDVKNKEAESLFDKQPEELRNYKRRFPNEHRFPVLMLSFVGPQHGRLFYECMNGQQLVVLQSKLYSFERRAAAPLDLFARFLLSCPPREAPTQGTVNKRRSKRQMELEGLRDGQVQSGKRAGIK